MTETGYLLDLIDDIRLRHVIEYMHRRGWRARLNAKETRYVFEGETDDEGNPMPQMLPCAESIPDFPRRVNDLLHFLQELENRPAVDIAREMLSLGTPEAFSDIVVEEIQKAVRDGRVSFTVEDPVEALRPSLQAADAVAGFAKGQAGDVRPTALVLAAFVRVVSDDGESRDLLKRITDRCLAKQGVRLAFSKQAVDGLFDSALNDDTDAPKKVMRFLDEQRALVT